MNTVCILYRMSVSVLVNAKAQYDELLMLKVNTNPVHCPALQQRAQPPSPQTGPSVTSTCTSLQSRSSCTLQRGRDTQIRL